MFLKKDEAVVRKGLQQFHGRRVVKTKKPQGLIYEQLRKTMAYPIYAGVLSYIDAEYLKYAKMNITRDKIHKYLGMNIDYSLPGKLIFYVINFIGNILNDIPEYMKG